MSNLDLQIPIGVEPAEVKKLDLSTTDTGKIKIDDGDTLIYFNEAFRIADEIRKPRENIWRQCWDLYNNRYDWTGKEAWQARIAIPKVRGTVDKATATFRRALVRMKRFYQIESETRLGIEKGLFTMSLMDYHLDQVNFIRQFSEGLKNGLITSSIIYKIWWNWTTDYEPRFEDRLVKEPIVELGIKVGEKLIPMQELVKTARVKGQLGIKAVDSFNMWVGPRDGYKIEKTTVDYAYLKDLADKGIYEKEAVEELQSLSSARINAALEAIRKGENPTKPINKFIREVDLYHYWGPLYNKEGEIIHRNQMFTVSGSGSPGGASVVLRKPQANSFFHGKDPYIIGTPYTIPFATYHRGIVEDIIGIAKMMTELSCLIIDGGQFDAMQAFEIDTDLLEDPRQAKRGIYPGVAFATKSFENPSGKPVVRNIQVGKVPELALSVLGFLDREMQLSSSVQNASRGEIGKQTTATEFTSVTGMAADTLDDAARTVEETALDDLLDKVSKTIYQYHDDYTLPRLTENFPQTAIMLSDMEPEERYATMVGGFNFKARGVSIFLDKSQDLQKITSFIQLIANLPGILERINVDEMLQEIIVALGWNPTKILPNNQQPVIAPAVQGGQDLPVGPNGMPSMDSGSGQLTPMQQMSGQQGARLGGSTNNPQANPNV